MHQQPVTQGAKEPGHQEPAKPEVDVPSDIVELANQFGPPAYLNKNNRVEKLNQLFWAALHAKENTILFDSAQGEFFAYDSATGVFHLETEDAVRKKLAEAIFEAGKTWVGYPGLTEFRSEHALRGIIAHLRGLVEEHDAFLNGHNLLHLANCSVRVTLQGFETEPISPLHRALYRSPICYDPNAQCPKFKEMLLGPLSLDDQSLLQKMFALTLTGSNPLHKITVIDGVGGAGKTTYVLTIAQVLGLDKTATLRTKYLGDRFEIGQLYRKNLLIGPDVDSDFFQTEGASHVKALSGGDILKGERKGSNQTFDVHGRFNILISANTRLKIRLQGDASAWLRRLVIVRYSNTYTHHRILDFHRLLAAQEGAGIVNFGLAGLELLRRDIESVGDIVLSTQQLRRVHSLVQESDGLRIFLQYAIASSQGSYLTVEQLVESYTKFCQERDWSVDSPRKIQSSLETLMLELFSVGKSNDIKHQGGTVRGFRNVKFRTDEEEDIQ